MDLTLHEDEHGWAEAPHHDEVESSDFKARASDETDNEAQGWFERERFETEGSPRDRAEVLEGGDLESSEPEQNELESRDFDHEFEREFGATEFESEEFESSELEEEDKKTALNSVSIWTYGRGATIRTRGVVGRAHTFRERGS